MNSKLTSVKNFANRNKKRVVIAALAVTTAGTVLMVRNQKQFNEFLREHDLLDTYYTPDAE